jgi:hypothetical protein
MKHSVRSVQAKYPDKRVISIDSKSNTQGHKTNPIENLQIHQDLAPRLSRVAHD